MFLEYLQEEIKIIEANVFVNPYTEPDEEEEEKEKAEKEKNEDKDIVSITPSTIYSLSSFSLLSTCLIRLYIYTFVIYQEKVGSWYSNPGSGTAEGGAGTGGVGKYLKPKSNAATKDTSGATDSDIAATGVSKKRKTTSPSASTGFKDFSGW